MRRQRRLAEDRLVYGARWELLVISNWDFATGRVASCVDVSLDVLPGGGFGDDFAVEGGGCAGHIGRVGSFLYFLAFVSMVEFVLSVGDGRSEGDVWGSLCDYAACRFCCGILRLSKIR